MEKETTQLSDGDFMVWLLTNESGQGLVLFLSPLSHEFIQTFCSS